MNDTASQLYMLLAFAVGYATSSQWEKTIETGKKAERLSYDLKAYLRWEESCAIQGYAYGVQGKFTESMKKYGKSYQSAMTRADPHLTSIWGYAVATNYLKLQKVEEGKKNNFSCA